LKLRHLLLTTMLVTGFALPAMSEEFTKDQINTMIHDYIMANPHVLIETINKMQEDAQKDADTKFTEELQKHSDWLYKNKNHYEAGNPNGKVTIVEFFDYNCGYCKQALPDVMTLLDENKDLRLIFVEIPILGDSSVSAAHWALAAGKQGQYLPYHTALMKHHGALTDEVMADYASKVGSLNIDQMKKDKDAPEESKILDENLEMAQTLGIAGTPAFIIGKEIIRGYVGLPGMRDAINHARLE